MIRGKLIPGASFLLAVLMGSASSAWGQSGGADSRGTGPDRQQLREPVYKVAQQLIDANGTGGGTAPAGQQSQAQSQPSQQEHPLDPALKLAHQCLDTIQKNIKDYTCTMYKRERISGKLGETEAMFVKIRQQPFSAYTYFLSPARLRGQEAIYVAGRNNGKLIAHGVGLKKAIGTVYLDPTGILAMDNQRYPITEIGLLNLTKRLIERAEQDRKYDECEVKFYNDAKINGRPCIGIQVTHPIPRRNFIFYQALVYIDKEYNVPVHYEAYEWPDRPGGKAPLLEEYTYVNLKFNQGLTDADFDEHNKSYKFH